MEGSLESQGKRKSKNGIEEARSTHHKNQQSFNLKVPYFPMTSQGFPGAWQFHTSHLAF
jgi:hypothetical protein